jgi:hypothetical protein
MFLVFSHALTAAQRADAKARWGVEAFVALPSELQTSWSNIPPQIEYLDAYLDPIMVWLREQLRAGDVVLVQGDFGATCQVVRRVESLGAVAVHATTRRTVVETHEGNQVIKRSLFEHVAFRRYTS